MIRSTVMCFMHLLCYIISKNLSAVLLYIRTMQKGEKGSSVNILGALASSSPQFGVAVRAAEAGAVVDVLIGHQPLQRINRLQTRHTGLPHRQTEALHAHTE